MKVEIEYAVDSYDCETCGGSYAESYLAYIDGELIAGEYPYAYCFGSRESTFQDVMTKVLQHLGHELVFIEREQEVDEES